MLTIVEKRASGAMYDIVYRIPSRYGLESVTVVLLLDEGFHPISRGMSICSPSEVAEKHHDGYRRAKGRALTAIREQRECLYISGHRINSRILPELRSDPDHPVHLAYAISHWKMQADPTTTELEDRIIFDFVARIMHQKAGNK